MLLDTEAFAKKLGEVPGRWRQRLKAWNDTGDRPRKERLEIVWDRKVMNSLSQARQRTNHGNQGRECEVCIYAEFGRRKSDRSKRARATLDDVCRKLDALGYLYDPPVEEFTAGVVYGLVILRPPFLPNSKATSST